MTEVLKALIKNAQDTGGIITFTCGLSAPAGDPLWTGLGETILKAHAELKEQGIDAPLDIENVDYSAKDAVDEAEVH